MSMSHSFVYTFNNSFNTYSLSTFLYQTAANFFLFIYFFYYYFYFYYYFLFVLCFLFFVFFL